MLLLLAAINGRLRADMRPRELKGIASNLNNPFPSSPRHRQICRRRIDTPTAEGWMALHDPEPPRRYSASRCTPLAKSLKGASTPARAIVSRIYDANFAIKLPIDRLRGRVPPVGGCVVVVVVVIVIVVFTSCLLQIFISEELSRWKPRPSCKEHTWFHSTVVSRLV